MKEKEPIDFDQYQDLMGMAMPFDEEMFGPDERFAGPELTAYINENGAKKSKAVNAVPSPQDGPGATARVTV